MTAFVQISSTDCISNLLIHIHRSATTLKPLTGNVGGIDNLVTMQCSVWNRDSLISSGHPSRTHHKNCSGMPWGSKQRAQGVKWASKFPRSQSDRASLECAGTSLIHGGQRILKKGPCARHHETKPESLWPCFDRSELFWLCTVLSRWFRCCGWLTYILFRSPTSLNLGTMDIWTKTGQPTAWHSHN